MRDAKVQKQSHLRDIIERCLGAARRTSNGNRSGGTNPLEDARDLRKRNEAKFVRRAAGSSIAGWLSQHRHPIESAETNPPRDIVEQWLALREGPRMARTDSIRMRKQTHLMPQNQGVF